LPPTGELGVYVHFPWCRKLCPYCDFAVEVSAKEPPHRDYLSAVMAELAAQARRFAGRRLRSIYFGGGTPSWWDPGCLDELIAEVCATFAVERSALEITLEANPTDCTPERMQRWRGSGIGRLSIGVQSVDASELRVLGRDHRHGDGVTAVTAARSAGFTSVTCDVIFGAPVAGRDAPSSAVTLSTLADLGVEHLSVYELTIEERTAFGKRARAGRLLPYREEILEGLYREAHDLLASRGYEHYEISSYARPGHRGVHNFLYWSGGEFLGLGAGAASFWRRPGGGAQRWTNFRRVGDYLSERGGGRAAECSDLGAHEVFVDELWLAMRTSDGALAASLAAQPAVVARLVAEGLVEVRGDRISPNLRGFIYADTIAARIVQSFRDPGKHSG
jgi:oxygen-independent coproporphyrinogen-3 oxidase